jgi:HD-like signal output (HDOD) protein
MSTTSLPTEETIDLSKGTEELVKEIGIPASPTLLLELKNEVSKENIDLKKVEEAVLRDMAVAARVLKLANSAYYAGKKQINSIQQAFIRLGVKTFSQVVLSAAARETLGGKSPVNDKIWDHAELTAIVCKCISRKLMPDLEESAYIVGLFHDCALPMMLKKVPKYSDSIDNPLFYGDAYFKEEQKLFKTTHCLLGYKITETWQIQKNICDAISCHHETMIPPGMNELTAALLSIIILSENIIQMEKTNDCLLFSDNGSELMGMISQYLKIDPLAMGKLRFEVFAQLMANL